jgi:hypothetical protein
MFFFQEVYWKRGDGTVHAVCTKGAIRLAHVRMSVPSIFEISDRILTKFHRTSYYKTLTFRICLNLGLDFDYSTQ